MTGDKCPRCQGELKPTNHGLHHLHCALGRSICPRCYVDTQPARTARYDAKHRGKYEATVRSKILDDLKQLSEERASLRKLATDERVSLMQSIRSQVAAEEADKIRRLSLIAKIRWLFNPFGVNQ